MARNTEVAFIEKYGLSKADALRWILGSLALGGGARAGLGLYRSLTSPAPSIRQADMSDSVIDIPVDMSEGAAARYQDLRRRYGLDEEDEQDIAKVANEGAASSLPKPKGSVSTLPEWVDPALKALLGVGGSLAGWSVMSNLIRRNRYKKLNQELEEAQKELDMLSSISPRQIGQMGHPKLSAVAEWLDDMAELECDEICPTEKTAAGLKSILMRISKRMPAASTMGKGLATAGVLGGGAYAGNKLIKSTGEKVHKATSNVKKEVTEGSDSIMGKALGILSLIGAIPLMYGAYKGFSETSKVSPRRKRLQMFREELRKSEDAKPPYFRLRPRVSGRTEDPVGPKSTGPEDLGLTTPYKEEEEEELKSASDRLFNSLFVGY